MFDPFSGWNIQVRTRGLGDWNNKRFPVRLPINIIAQRFPGDGGLTTGGDPSRSY